MSPEPICVTLNPWQQIESSKIIRHMSFRHPVFDLHALHAQKRRAEISGRQRMFYCGAYWGNGFHEDGVQSALAVAAHFDLGIEDCTAVSTAGTSATSVLSP
jgi:predicted NAD/FAD-binding protein